MVEPVKMQVLDFEKPIFEMEAKIHELEELSRSTGMDLNGQMLPLKDKLQQLTKEIFHRLGAWEKIQLARHPRRPYTSDYINLIVEDFVELHGDRAFGDDPALACGLGTIDGRRVLILGHRKGRDVKEKIACNFGCAHPEGYRKAYRMMQLAEKFGLPIVTLINTPGAYPGIGAEERGQAWAIAENLMLMANLKVPIICFVIGEGGSGGALGIGIGDRVFILEHAYYSVISPEGCAAILWKSAGEAKRAAEALKLTSGDLLDLGIVDEIVGEPLGGAHRHPEEMAATVKSLILRELERVEKLPIEALIEERYAKFRAMGALFGDEPPRAPVVESEVDAETEAKASGDDGDDENASEEGV